MTPGMQRRLEQAEQAGISPLRHAHDLGFGLQHLAAYTTKIHVIHIGAVSTLCVWAEGVPASLAGV